jgi:hypothetical protein
MGFCHVILKIKLERELGVSLPFFKQEEFPQTFGDLLGLLKTARDASAVPLDDPPTDEDLWRYIVEGVRDARYPEGVEISPATLTSSVLID